MTLSISFFSWTILHRIFYKHDDSTSDLWGNLQTTSKRSDFLIFQICFWFVLRFSCCLKTWHQQTRVSDVPEFVWIFVWKFWKSLCFRFMPHVCRIFWKICLLFKKNLRCVLKSDHIFHMFLIMKTNLAVSIVFLNLPSCFKGRPQHNQNVSDCLC